MHIHTLAVSPLARGRGLGRRLLGRVLDLGARRGASSAFLEVRQSNWAALALYRSFGFDVILVRRGYYERPREDALVLQKTALVVS
jgi:ribosomal-protein-alanine N-acetyltransferase